LRRIVTILLSGQHCPDTSPYYGNYMQLKCNRLDARATPFRHGLIQERFSRLYGKLVAQLIVQMASACVWMPPREN
jgi:hypothetical protein